MSNKPPSKNEQRTTFQDEMKHQGRYGHRRRSAGDVNRIKEERRNERESAFDGCSPLKDKRSKSSECFPLMTIPEVPTRSEPRHEQSPPPSYRTSDGVVPDFSTEKPHPNWSFPREYKTRNKKNGNCDEKFLKACRVLWYGILFILVHGSGVLSILYLLSLVSVYSQTEGGQKVDIGVDIVVCSAFCPLFSLLIAAWRVIFQSRKRLFKRKAVFLVAMELISCTGEFLLLFKVLGKVDSASAVIVLLSVMIVPAFLQCFRSLNGIRLANKKHKCCRTAIKNLMTVSPILLQIACLVILLKILNNETLDIFMPVAVIMRSIGYWENFCNIRYFSKHLKRKGKDLDVKEKGEKEAIENTSDKQSLASHQSEERQDQRRKERDHLSDVFKSVVKVVLAVIIIVLWKIRVTIPILMEEDAFSEVSHPYTIKEKSFILPTTTYIPVNTTVNTILNTTVNTTVITTDTNAMTETLISLNDEHPISKWFGVFYDDHHLAMKLILLSLTFPYFASLACRIQMQRVSFTLPLVLIPISSYIVAYFSCVSEENILLDIMETLGIQLTCSEDTYDADWEYKLATGAGLLCSVLILTWYLWFPNIERMAKLDRMYILPLRNGIFTVFDVLLKRRHDSKRSKLEAKEETPECPDIKICVTMWHETFREMFQLLKSLFKLDMHVAMRENLVKEMKGSKPEAIDPDKIKIEIHVIFDNAFEYTKKGRVLNEYVIQFINTMEKAATEIIGQKDTNDWLQKVRKPKKYDVAYGGRLKFTLPGQTQMIVHLKDKTKVRIKKRWSQVLYMYYTLLYGFEDLLLPALKQKLKNTFIFTLDGDVDFEPKSVWLLMDRMKKNPDVGAVCGRIHPIGSGPMVWYQQFEYAVGHWLQKASEHVFGCVLCCPGCFSIFRASALVDDNILKTYTREPEEGKHLVQFEQGEDRWLCTLLLKRGYKIDYCAGADAKTFAPEGFNEFFIQRRRWSPSTLANMIDLIKSWGTLVQNNSEINHFFMLYQCVMVGTSLFAPATVIILIAGSFSTVLHLSGWYSFLVATCPVLAFAVSCFVCKQDKQLLLASILSTAYTFVMVIVTVGMILSIVSESVLEPNVVFLAFVGSIFVIAALIHPKEFSCIFGGLLYYVTVPSTFIFLTVFFVCNMNDVSWGTREKKSTGEVTKQPDKSLLVLTKDLLKKLLKEKLELALNSNSSDNTTIASPDTESTPTEVEEATCEEDALFWMKTKEIKQFTKEDLTDEHLFWKLTIDRYLKPLEGNKKLQEKFQEELIDLRNKCVYGFFMVNIMLALALLQLQVSRDQLKSFYILGKYEPVSTICLILFAILLFIQILGMFKHRWGTFLHLISSTELVTPENNINFEETFKEIEAEFMPDHPVPDYDELEPDYPVGDVSTNNEASNAANSNAPRNIYETHVNNVVRRRPSLLESQRHQREHFRRRRPEVYRQNTNIRKRYHRGMFDEERQPGVSIINSPW